MLDFLLHLLLFCRYDNEVLRKLIEPVTSSAAPGAWKVYDKKDVFPSLRELIDFYTKNKIVECNGFAVDPATAVCTLTQVLIKVNTFYKCSNSVSFCALRRVMKFFLFESCCFVTSSKSLSAQLEWPVYFR